MEIKYKFMKSKDLPPSVYKLTRGEHGIMEHWLNRRRDKLICYTAFHKGKLIGWSGVIQDKPGLFEWYPSLHVSVFVAEKYRKHKVAKRLVRSILRRAALVYKYATMHYGAPSDHEYFNRFYEKIIPHYGFKPVCYF